MECRKAILVVEDDNDIRKNTVEALELEDYKVLQAENGQVALDLLKGLPKAEIPSCILLDLSDVAPENWST